MTPSDEPQARLRRSVYLILIVAGIGLLIGRILAVESVDMVKRWDEEVKVKTKEKREALKKEGISGERLDLQVGQFETELREKLRARMMRPFLSANDRSRWCTVRALVEPEMRVYEEAEIDGQKVRRWVPYAIDNVIQVPTWDTIDMVKHDDQGRGGLGPNEGHLYSSKPPLLATLVAAEYWAIHALTGETLGTHPYAIGRFMLVTINVLPLLICFVLLGRLVERFGTTDWGRMFVMAAAVFGTFLGTFSVVFNNHVPAAVCGLVALYTGIRIWFDGERRWHYFVLAGLFAALAAATELPAAAFCGLLSLALLWRAPGRTLLYYVPAAAVVTAAFFATNWISHRDLRPPYAHRDKDRPENNWYDYSYFRSGRVIKSYWLDPAGIDRGEKSRATYAVHALVGHHGVFSLTPVWLLSVAGLGAWLIRPGDRRLRHLALFVGALSLVCLVFYTVVVTELNYGGMTSGFRWMFWFAPMWLLVMLPAADWAAGRPWTRGLALVLLCVSALSAAYPTWNPWTHPWIYNAMAWLEWL
jgi:hypothetical protein